MPTGFSDYELREGGFLPGLPGITIGPFDKKDHFFPREDQPVDIWEERDGVRSRYQPQALLLSEPLLWGAYNDWLLGVHELSEDSVERRSNFEIEAIIQLQAARNRKLFPDKDYN